MGCIGLYLGDISTANISREKEESQEKLRGFPCFSLSVRNPGG